MKIILDGQELTYIELQEKFNNLGCGYDWQEYIELSEVQSDGTLVFTTECISFVGG